MQIPHIYTVQLLTNDPCTYLPEYYKDRILVVHSLYLARNISIEIPSEIDDLAKVITHGDRSMKVGVINQYHRLGLCMAYFKIRSFEELHKTDSLSIDETRIFIIDKDEKTL